MLGRNVYAVLVEPLEERQEVRAGFVAFLGDALLVVRDAQRRLYYGIDRWAEWQLDGVEVDTMASRLTRKNECYAAPCRRGRRVAKVLYYVQRCPRSLPPGRADGCVRPLAQPVGQRLWQQ